MSPYIRLILLLPVLQGCLVVRTPKCECPVLEMSSSNIVYNVGNHSFYQNVSGYPLVEPVVKSEDCSVSMYCEGGDSLVVFDKDKVTMFGAYSADGICDPRTQKWQVATDSGAAFTSFDRLFGTCVNYSPICSCPIRKISDNATAKEFLSDYDNFETYKVLQFSEPILNNKTGICPSNFHCKESGHGKITITDRGILYMEENLQFECRASKTWTVRLSEENIPTTNIKLLNVGCYKQETCNSTIPCSYKAVDKASDSIDFPYYENLSGHKAKAPEVTIDGCYVTMTCDKTYALIIMDFQNMYPTPYSSERAQCLPGRWWRLTELGPLGIFLAICVEL